MRTYLWLFEYS